MIHYRSPIDRLVSNSGISATRVSKRMGISVNRMIALRRACSVTPEEIEQCKQAIRALKGHVAPEAEDLPSITPPSADFILGVMWSRLKLGESQDNVLEKLIDTYVNSV